MTDVIKISAGLLLICGFGVWVAAAIAGAGMSIAHAVMSICGGGAVALALVLAYAIQQEQSSQLSAAGRRLILRLRSSEWARALVLYLGGPIIALSLAIFAFTTIIGWSYYSERSLQYLFGTGIIMPFRAVWSLAVIVGATIKLGFVWLLADTLNAMMAIPNLIALIVLSPVVFAITKEFFDTRGKSENNPF